MPRKALHPDCNGSIDCVVEDHLQVKVYGNGRRVYSHVKLTRGQHDTLDERRADPNWTRSPSLMDAGR